MSNRVKRSMEERMDHLDTHMERIQQLLEHILEGRDPHLNTPLSIEKLNKTIRAVRFLTLYVNQKFASINGRMSKMNVWKKKRKSDRRSKR